VSLPDARKIMAFDIREWEVPNQNVTMRRHWAATNLENKYLRLIAMSAAHPRRRIQEGHPRKRPVIITTFRTRLIKDRANLSGGAKGLIDAMVHARLLHDDSDQWMDAEYHQALSSESPTGRPFTHIQLIELEQNRPTTGKD